MDKIVAYDPADLVPASRIDHWLSLTVTETWPRFIAKTLPLCELIALEEALLHFHATAEANDVRVEIESLQRNPDRARELHEQAKQEDNQKDLADWENDQELQQELTEEDENIPDVVDLLE